MPVGADSQAYKDLKQAITAEDEKGVKKILAAHPELKAETVTVGISDDAAAVPALDQALCTAITLHAMTQSKEVPILEELKAAGASVNAADSMGKVPALARAIAANDKDAFDWLLAKGADPNARTGWKSSIGEWILVRTEGDDFTEAQGLSYAEGLVAHGGKFDSRTLAFFAKSTKKATVAVRTYMEKPLL